MTPDIVISLRKTGATAEYGKPLWAWRATDGIVTLAGAELAGWHDARGMSGDLAGLLAAYGEDDLSGTRVERVFGKRHHDALDLYASDMEDERRR
jgi:hypothetical protein